WYASYSSLELADISAFRRTYPSESKKSYTLLLSRLTASRFSLVRSLSVNLKLLRPAAAIPQKPTAEYPPPRLSSSPQGRDHPHGQPVFLLWSAQAGGGKIRRSDQTTPVNLRWKKPATGRTSIPDSSACP